MTEPKWDFPTNNYGEENGLNTSNMEMFSKDPLSSLAREVCQNSIDACTSDAPVIVEFQLFRIPTIHVPGITDLRNNIEACYDFKKNSKQEGPALNAIKSAVSERFITCLRISDFNTTGITGVDTNDRGTPFYNLTRGSGVSDKPGSSAGSKGIGKYASFVTSLTNTVFYSTQTIENTQGYIGISHLRSTPINSDPELMTTGMGFYGLGTRHLPVQEELHLDPSFTRSEGQCGTDIFIIGFDETSSWREEILAETLRSFMVAIVRGKLELKIGNILVSRKTLHEVMAAKQYASALTPTEEREIDAQYELLSENSDVEKTEIVIENGLSVSCYMKRYSQADSSNATKRIIMVRYPYMKIKHYTTGIALPFSALCIIEEGDLANDLRLIENPQHTDWEIKRLNTFPAEKSRIKRRLKKLKELLNNCVADFLKNSITDSTDIIGAGDYLPSTEDFGESKSSSETPVQDAPKISPLSVTKVRVPKTVKTSDAGEAFDFSNGELAEEGEEGRVPNPNDGKPHPNPYPDPESNPEDSKKVHDGDQAVLRKVPLSGMRYRNIVRSKSTGTYMCCFDSLFDEQNCEFQIRMCGEANDKYPVPITSASINGEALEIEDGVIKGIRLQKGASYRIEYTVDKTDYFASEVILNAYR